MTDAQPLLPPPPEAPHDLAADEAATLLAGGWRVRDIMAAEFVADPDAPTGKRAAEIPMVDVAARFLDHISALPAEYQLVVLERCGLLRAAAANPAATPGADPAPLFDIEHLPRWRRWLIRWALDAAQRDTPPPAGTLEIAEEPSGRARGRWIDPDTGAVVARTFQSRAAALAHYRTHVGPRARAAARRAAGGPRHLSTVPSGGASSSGPSEGAATPPATPDRPG